MATRKSNIQSLVVAVVLSCRPFAHLDLSDGYLAILYYSAGQSAISPAPPPLPPPPERYYSLSMADNDERQFIISDKGGAACTTDD